MELNFGLFLIYGITRLIMFQPVIGCLIKRIEWKLARVSNKQCEALLRQSPAPLDIVSKSNLFFPSWIKHRNNQRMYL